MKALIWIGTLFIGGIISTLLGYTIGFKLGPIIVLIMIIVAKKLCDMWDERKSKKKPEKLPEANQNSDLDTVTEAVATMTPSTPIIKEDELIHSTASIPENVISEDPINNTQYSNLITVFENAVTEKVNEPTLVEEDSITPTPSISSTDSKEDPVKPAQNADLKATFQNAYSKEYAKASKDPNETDSPIIHNNKASKKWIAATISLFVIVLVLSGFTIYKYEKDLDFPKQISDLNATIQHKNDVISSQYSEIGDLNKKIYALQGKAAIYDIIIKSIKNGNLGYASNNFKASESIIVVKQNEQNRCFTVTTNWSKSAKIYDDRDGNSAYVFAADSNSKTTKMRIYTATTGVTVVTFSNSLNNEKFDVIIIVE